MAQVLTDRRDIDFVLYEQFDVEEFTRREKFKDFNKKTFDLIVNEARNLAVKEILPTYAEGDREGVKFEGGRVTVPACYHRPYKLMREGEWTAMIADPELWEDRDSRDVLLRRHLNTCTERISRVPRMGFCRILPEN